MRPRSAGDKSCASEDLCEKDFAVDSGEGEAAREVMGETLECEDKERGASDLSVCGIGDKESEVEDLRS